MKRLLLLCIIFISACTGPDFDPGFISKELVSSKGEKIYINTYNWGVTGDHQWSIITHDKNRLKEGKIDSAGAVKGCAPFLYFFNNDTLTLYGSNYKPIEEFYTITIMYATMPNPWNDISQLHRVPEFPEKK
jgi:hypothetical protein